MTHYIHARKKTTKSSSHMPAVIVGFNQMFQMPVISFVLIFIVAFALFLPAGFYVLRKNVKALDGVWSQSVEISLYLKKKVSPKEVTDVIENLKSNDAIMGFELIAPDEGIKDFAARAGFGEILLGVKSNPLPHVIIVYPELSQLSESNIRALVDGLKNIPEVEVAKIDMDWAARSYRLLSLFNTLSLMLSLLLSIGAVVIVCGVSYMAPQAIRERANASERTLKYQCFWYALIGGLLSIGLIKLVLMIAQSSSFVLQGLGLNYSVVLVLSGIVLSVISEGVSAKKTSACKKQGLR
jgi:cell division transport system permease protein